LLIDTKVLDLYNITEGQNLDAALENLALTINNGSLPSVDVSLYNHKVISRVMSVSQCHDGFCNSLNITALVTAPRPYHGGTASFHNFLAILYCTIITAFTIAFSI